MGDLTPASAGPLLSPEILFANRKPPAQAAPPAVEPTGPVAVPPTAAPPPDQVAVAVGSEGQAEAVLPFQESEPEPVAPSQAELDLAWVQELEQRLQKGYAPTPDEVRRYNEIQFQLAIGGTSPRPTPPPAQTDEAPAARPAPRPSVDATPPVAPAAPVAPEPALAPVTEAEIRWAQDLEQKLQAGQAPNAQEIQRYQDILDRLAATSRQALQNLPPDAPFTRDDIQWAGELEQKVEAGYAPSPEEVSRYQELAQKVSQYQQDQ